MIAVGLLVGLGAVPAGAQAEGEGWTREVTVEAAAFTVPGAPSAVVHAPSAFDVERPLRLVVFLHGWMGCARAIVRAGEVPCRDGGPTRTGWDLAGAVERSGAPVLLVVPQLAFLRRSGDPGAFREPGRFRAFLSDILAAAVPDRGLEAVGDILLVAHSAGFETALAVLRAGGVDGLVRGVVLLDALYRGVEPFLDWVHEQRGRTLASLVVPGGRPARQSRRLLRMARARDEASQVAHGAGADLERLWPRRRVLVLETDSPHGRIPVDALPALLRGWDEAGPGRGPVVSSSRGG